MAEYKLATDTEERTFNTIRNASLSLSYGIVSQTGVNANIPITVGTSGDNVPNVTLIGLVVNSADKVVKDLNGNEYVGVSMADIWWLHKNRKKKIKLYLGNLSTANPISKTDGTEVNYFVGVVKSIQLNMNPNYVLNSETDRVYTYNIVFELTGE